MKVWKRASAFLCVVVLILDLALFPIRARATVGALTAVGAAVTVSAFLMACGIYPYVSEDGQSFGEWGAQSLSDLWREYVSSFEDGQLPSGGTVETFNQIKSFVVGNTLAIASGTWETLRGFASWIVEKFSVTDNQVEVKIGSYASAGVSVPYVSGAYGGQGYNYIVENGLYLGKGRRGATVSVLAFNGVSDLHLFYLRNPDDSSNLAFMLFSFQAYTTSDVYYTTDTRYYDKQVLNANVHKQNITVDGTSYTVWGYGDHCGHGIQPDTIIPGQTIYESPMAAFRAFLGLSDIDTPFVGILADTTTVAPLEALPADTPWGGLAVQGTSNPAGTVEQGVSDREKPVVRPVEVEIQQGTDVDSETGEVTENPVVVSPEDVIPTVAALSPPASFISALQTTMTTKFPFCLPFDLFKILQAFYVAPEAPVFSLSFHDPFSNSDFSIRVDLSPWDEVAAVVRNFEAMILLAGFCLNFDKFNVIHLILGGLG